MFSKRKHKISFISTAWQFLILAFLMLLSNNTFSQLLTDTTMTPLQLVQNVLVGTGVTVSNVTFTGATVARGSFSNGNTTNIGISNGILISTGEIADAAGPNNQANKSTNNFAGSDPQLSALIPGYGIYDAAVLEFDFVPMSDTIRFKYVFSSEEYPEYVNSNFNDVFGFFVSGPDPSGGSYINKNIALIPGTTLPVTIDNINNTIPSYPQYFVDNAGGTTIQFDGFTTVLIAEVVVTPCQTYHIKIAIGDAGDNLYDSGVFLEENSFSSNAVAVNTVYSIPGASPTAVEGCNNAIVNFTLPNPTTYDRVFHYSIGGTAINGVDYTTISDSIIIPTGSDSVAIVIFPYDDGITEGTEYIQLIVQVNLCNTDTLFIPINDYDSVITAASANVTICEADSTTISTITTNGVRPLSYLWSNMAGTDSSAIVHPFNSVVYHISVTDACNVVASDSVEVTVNQRPSLLLSATDTIICSGLSTIITASGASTYVWSPSTGLSATTGSMVTANPNTSTTYTVIGTDNNGCVDTATIVITVKSTPTVNVSPAASTICEGSSDTLTASGAISYSWSPANGLSSTTGASVVASPLSTITYQITGTAANGCMDSTSVIINVNSKPNVIVSPSNPSICAGDSVLITASAASQYSWAPASGLSSATGAAVYAYPNTSTTYIVTGTDANNCSNTDTAYVEVNSLPNVILSVKDSSICDSSSITINASGAISYLWSPAQGLSTTSGATVVASPNSSITYYVVGTDVNGCFNTDTSTIVVSPNPGIIVSNSIICKGATTMLTASSTLAGTSYLWSNGGTTSSVTVSPNVTTTYNVSATDGNGCDGSASTVINVYPTSVITTSPGDTAICVGDSAFITASGALTYSWSPGNGLSSTFGASIIANPVISTSYIVTGIDANNCPNNDTINIIVNNLPNVIVIPDDTSICDSTSINIIASGALNYNWSPATALSANAGSSVIASPNSSITYVVTGTDVNGCVNTDTSFIEVSPNPGIIASNSTICIGDSAVLSANSTLPGTNYSWNTGGNNSSIIVSPIITTTYTVTAIDGNGCDGSASTVINVYSSSIITTIPGDTGICKGESVLVSASGTTTYSWSPAYGLSATSGASIVATPDSTTIYTIVGTSANGCNDTSSIIISVYPLPNVKISPNDTAICDSTSIMLTASGANTYQWTPGTTLNSTSGSPVIASPSSNTAYIVTGTDTLGCQNNDTINVVMSPNPYISPVFPQICYGDSITLTVYSAFGGTSYLWSTGDTSSSITVSPAVTTTYTVTASDTYGCTGSAGSVLVVFPKPVVTVTPPKDTLCNGDSVNLIAGGASTYLWSPSAGLSSSVGASVTALPSSSVTYTVIGSDGNGCLDTSDVPIIVNPNVNLSLSAVSQSICFGDTTIITANGATTYLWSPSTGLSSTSGNVVSANPAVTTTYKVFGYNVFGCSDSATIAIIVNSLPSVNVNPATSSACQGFPVSLSLNGANTYFWAPATGLSSTSGSTVTATPAVTTTYTIIGTDINGCEDTTNAVVTINQNPVLSITPVNPTICHNTSQTLVVSGTTNYQWSPATGLSNTTNDTVISTPSSSITYTVIGIDSNNCSDTADVTVNVIPNPSITPNNASICVGDSVTIIAYGTLPGSSYLWNNTSTNANITVNPTTSTTYTVTTTDTLGCIGSASSTINVNALPILSFTPPNPEVCNGFSANLSVTGASTYSWSPSTALSATTGSNVTTNPANTITYTVTGIDSNACIDSNQITVVVYQQPNISISPNNPAKCDSAIIPLVAGGGSTYLWSPGAALSSTTGDTVYASPFSTTTYTVIGADTNGCKDTISTILIVSPNPIISSSTPVICLGDTALITVSSTLPATTYYWSTGSGSDSIKVSPTTTTSYSVTATDTSGCKGSSSSVITINPLPNVAVSPSNPQICIGTSVNLSASGAVTYFWSPASGLSSTTGASVVASPVTATTYTVVGTDANGCRDTAKVTVSLFGVTSITVTPANSYVCDSVTSMLTVNGANSYAWSPVAGLSTVTGDTTIASPLSTSTYTVIGTDTNGCTDTAVAVVTRNTGPTISILPNNPILCDGVSTPLIASGASNYFWAPNFWLDTTAGAQVITNPPATITYTVNGVDSNGCYGSGVIVVTVFRRPALYLTPTNSTICPGDSVTISGYGASTYTWSPLTGLSNTNSSSVIAKPGVSTTYTCIGTDQVGCVDTVQLYVNLYPDPAVTVVATDSIICIGGTSTLTASGAVSYSWAPSAGLSSTIGNNVIASPTSTTTYTIIGTDANGCIDTASITIYVNPKPNITISSTKDTICIGDSTYLSVSGATNYFWSPATSISNPNSASTFATPFNSTTYTVIGMFATGCSDTISLPITVFNYPIVSLTSSNQNICYGDTVNLTAGGALNYLWSPATGLSNVSGNQTQAIPLSNITYTVIGANIAGCSDTSNISITVYQKPIIIASAVDSQICYGDTTALNVIGANTYLWSPSTTLSNINSNTVQAFPSLTTTYTVIGTDTNGCLDTASTTVIVNSLPVINIIPDSSIICDGDTVVLNSSGANTYQWTPATGLLSTVGPQVVSVPFATMTYTVTGTDTNGCVDSSTAFVLVNPNPIISINPQLSAICYGDSTTLISISNIPGTSYQWNTNSTTDSIIVAPIIATTYTVTGTTAAGCIGSASATVNINPLPNIAVTPDSSIICIGSSSNLTASGASTYQWSPATGLSVTTGTSVIAAPLTTTTYTVIGTDTNGCRDTAYAVVIVRPLPNIAITPDSSIICYGDTLILNSSGANNYQWTPATGLLSTTGPQVVSLPMATITYTVIGTDTNGCIDSSTSFIHVNPIPIVSINPSLTAICIGDSITLTAISNIPGTTYLWNTNSTLDSISVAPNISTSYSLTATTLQGCIDTASAHVNINSYPIVNILPNNPILCLGDSMFLKASSSIGNLTYTWNSITVCDSICISPTITCCYTVIGSDTVGCSGFDTIFITPHQKPIVSSTTSSPIICYGDSAIINAVSPNSGLSYLWSTGAPTSSIIVAPTLASSFTVTATDSIGCSDTTSAKIYVNPIPVVSIIPNNPTICLGDTGSLSASSSVNNVNYQWSNNGLTNSIIVNPQITTTYTVTATDTIGCAGIDTSIVSIEYGPPVSISPSNPSVCFGDTATLTASSSVTGVTYQWNTSTVGNTLTVNPQVNTAYYVIGTNLNGCKDTTHTIIVVYPNPIINISPTSSVICQGDSVQLTVNSNIPIISYQWSDGSTTNPKYFSPNNTTSFIVIAEDTNTCKGSDTALINVIPTPTSVISSVSPICSKDNTIITYSGSGTPTASYNWNFDGGSIMSGTNQGPYSIHWVNSGVYYVTLTVTENNCTSVADTAEVVVNETPLLNISATPTVSCESLMVQFNSNMPLMQNYNWSFGDPFASSNSSNMENPFHFYNVAGTYSVSLFVVSMDGCPAYQLVPNMITVNATPIALFSAKPSVGTINDPLITFDNNSIHSTIWNWDFGDPVTGNNNNSSLNSPFHSFSDYGTFVVTLIAMNNQGCADTNTLDIQIRDVPDFYVPNAFTPDGDGINDIFLPKGTNIDWGTFEMYIYNRWGGQVFYTQDVNEGWDGRRKGSTEVCQIGVFTWMITVRDIYGKTIQKNGMVTLIK